MFLFLLSKRERTKKASDKRGGNQKQKENPPLKRTRCLEIKRQHRHMQTHKGGGGEQQKRTTSSNVVLWVFQKSEGQQQIAEQTPARRGRAAFISGRKSSPFHRRGQQRIRAQSVQQHSRLGISHNRRITMGRSSRERSYCRQNTSGGSRSPKGQKPYIPQQEQQQQRPQVSSRDQSVQRKG